MSISPNEDPNSKKTKIDTIPTTFTPPFLFLAPMEGVADSIMRDTLTSLGGIDQCVSEFLRVTDRLYPDHVFYENCPELKTQSRTKAGVPIFLQLLGGQAEPLAENAYRAYELGALGIDLNFGCPAKTVNRHDGGASLLQHTHRLYDIVKTVRKAVPSHVPVTAKMRLGFNNPADCLENAKAIEEAGANWLTVHCRTKTDGYKPPAYWEWLPLIKEKINIPLIANGEINTPDDLVRCAHQSGCQSFMIGRAALRNPFIFNEIKMYLIANEIKMHIAANENKTDLSLNEVQSNLAPQQNKINTIESKEILNKQISFENKIISILNSFYISCETQVSSAFAVSRTKQWLSQLQQHNDFCKKLFTDLRIITQSKDFKSALLQFKTDTEIKTETSINY